MSLSSYKHVIDKNSSDIVVLNDQFTQINTEIQNNSGNTNSNLDLKEDKANKGIQNGYCPLNANAKIDKIFLENQTMHYTTWPLRGCL